MKRSLAILLALLSVFVARPSEATETSLAAWLYETTRPLPHSAAPGETREDYDLRLDGVVRAYAHAVIPYATGNAWTASELSMALMTLIFEETQLDERIHAGTPHPSWTQDHGLAKCLGQIHVSGLVPREEWLKLAGTDEDSTSRCADATALVWVRMAKLCGAWDGGRASRERVAATFMAYGSGGKCKPDDRAWARADKWLTRMQKRPDRTPIRGFRRALPSEVAPDVQREVAALREGVESGAAPVGFVKKVEVDSRQWALRVEQHAEGKIGVSVLVAER